MNTVVSTSDRARIVRPVSLGAPIGHPAGTGGTIGLFIEFGDGGSGFLSTAQVLAPRQARIGDFIHQPGPFDRLLTGATRIARLSGTGRGESSEIAVARMLPDVRYTRNLLPEGAPGSDRALAGPISVARLQQGEYVAMVGAGGTRVGRVTTNGEDAGIYEGLVVVRGTGAPFSLPGDAGALVYRPTDMAILGLVLASDGQGLTYVAPVFPFLEAHSLRVIGESKAASACEEVIGEPVAAQ